MYFNEALINLKQGKKLRRKFQPQGQYYFIDDGELYLRINNVNPVCMLNGDDLLADDWEVVPDNKIPLNELLFRGNRYVGLFNKINIYPEERKAVLILDCGNNLTEIEKQLYGYDYETIHLYDTAQSQITLLYKVI